MSCSYRILASVHERKIMKGGSTHAVAHFSFAR
jgi:hypothetical protein